MTVKRPDSQSWTESKRHADAAELAVAEYFKRLDCQMSKTLGLDSFDLLLQLRIEVKRDLQATKTGNVAIEVACNGKPSGIMATGADRWVIVVGTVGYMVRTVQLRALVKTENFQTVSAGDGKRAQIRLVPLRMVQSLEIFRQLDLSGLLR